MADILAQHGINLKEIKYSNTQVYGIKAEATFGVIEDPMFTHMLENSTMSYEDLEIIISKTLHMFHLAEPIMSLFEEDSEQIKLQQIIEKILKGQYYKKLQEQNPVWLLTNRQTQLNVKIIIASIILKTAKKLSLEEIKESITVFTLEENKDKSTGVPLNSNKVIQVLRNLNKTLSMSFLQNWIKNKKFDVDGWMLPHEFLYLVCYCSDRSSYLRLLPKANYKRIKNPYTCLYEIQPIKQIIGTPDFKIQLKLKQAAKQSIHKQVLKQKKIEQKTSKNSIITKSSKNLTYIQRMLRDESIYTDIKQCLKSKQKSDKVSNCLTRIKSTTLGSRPQTALHPIKIKEIVNSQYEYFDLQALEISKENFNKSLSKNQRTKSNTNTFRRLKSSPGFRKYQPQNKKYQRSLFSR